MKISNQRRGASQQKIAASHHMFSINSFFLHFFASGLGGCTCVSSHPRPSLRPDLLLILVSFHVLIVTVAQFNSPNSVAERCIVLHEKGATGLNDNRMAFSFGILGEIDATVATIAFVVTILFLTTFEFLTGWLEFIIEENPIYNQMLQRIYKELMIMGFITFVIAMYLASDNAGNKHS